MFRTWRFLVSGVQLTPHRHFRLQRVLRKYDPNKTLYQVLGVSPNASTSEIKQAYTIRYLEYKKTFDGGKPDHDSIQPYNQAYGVLVDEQNRAEYDYYLKKERLAGEFSEKKEPPPGPGIESPFYGFSQTHYRYPLFYTDPLLREEATKVWVRHLQMQTLDEMSKSDPKKLRRTIVLGLLGIFGLSGLIHLFVVNKMIAKRVEPNSMDFSKLTSPDQTHIGSGLRSQYMPKDVYYDEKTKTYRKIIPEDPFKVQQKEKNTEDLSDK